jgi:hypothetical protein
MRFLFYFIFSSCVRVYRKQKDCRFVLRPNNKMMILATFGLLFCCNRTISFLLFLFILIDALPCVCMSVGVLCTPFFFLYFILYLSLSFSWSCMIDTDKNTKREKNIDFFFFFAFVFLFSFCSLCIQQTHINTHK